MCVMLFITYIWKGKRNDMVNIKRNILLNPGPATTTDSVKMAQVVPDICPREKEFVNLMNKLREDLLKVVHADPRKYTSVLFCGSGTINMDVCINSLIPEKKKILIINNGAYSSRAVDICIYYGISYTELRFPIDSIPDLEKIEQCLRDNSDIEVVYITHHETGTGLLNPIKQIGEIVHKYNSIFIVDTTSTFAMIPIDIEVENIDFCMASAQKGLMSMTGLSFIVGNRSIIERSKDYPKRSYYCNLYLQYHHFEKNGEMHFTPPVQTIYATVKALEEYFIEGEVGKWQRHIKIIEEIHKGLRRLGFSEVIKEEYQSGLVAAVLNPDDINWQFNLIHDYCYERGFTIYPGKIDNFNTFRLCALGAITEEDIKKFFKVLEEAMKYYKVQIPVYYDINQRK